MLYIFLNPGTVARHLGQGRFRSVFKASLLGIPIPLCSCGVLPAAASLKRQGANNGATMSFLISTPESGVDSMAITYALLDPIMTIARPVAAFFTAQGYDARTVGGPGDLGIDVEIYSNDSLKWGVAQCKRYDPQNRVATKQVLQFAGAYQLSEAEHGFLVTTGTFTRSARRIARRFEWLTIYDGHALAKKLLQLQRTVEELISQFNSGDTIHNS